MFQACLLQGETSSRFPQEWCLFFLDPLSAGYKSLWRSSNEKETAESRNKGGRGSDDGDPALGTPTPSHLPYSVV